LAPLQPLQLPVVVQSVLTAPFHVQDATIASFGADNMASPIASTTLTSIEIHLRFILHLPYL